MHLVLYLSRLTELVLGKSCSMSMCVFYRTPNYTFLKKLLRIASVAFFLWGKQSSSIFSHFKKDRSKKYLKTKMLWLLQEAAPDVFDPLYSNFPIQNLIEISKNMTSNLRFCTGFPIQMWSCNFCQCIGSASWRSHNIFVFKYFFDRSFLKCQKINEDCFPHRKNATEAMC